MCFHGAQRSHQMTWQGLCLVDRALVKLNPVASIIINTICWTLTYFTTPHNSRSVVMMKVRLKGPTSYLSSPLPPLFPLSCFFHIRETPGSLSAQSLRPVLATLPTQPGRWATKDLPTAAHTGAKAQAPSLDVAEASALLKNISRSFTSNNG